MDGKENYSEILIMDEALPPELEPFMTMIVVHDPYAMSRKWFVYDNEGDEARYDEDW